jgi:hypothetical protein
MELKSIPQYLPVHEDAVLTDRSPICESCGQPAFEVRPFGPDGESVCERCAAGVAGRGTAVVQEREMWGPPHEVLPRWRDENGKFYETTPEFTPSKPE